MQPTFIHLHVHTEYSLVNGTVRIPELVRETAELEMPAVAVTDQGNLFSMVKFYRAAMQAGIKPIVGVDLWLADASGNDRLSRFVLLCRHHAGYLNLVRLVKFQHERG